MMTRLMGIASMLAIGTLCEAAIDESNPGSSTSDAKPAKGKAEVTEVTMADGRKVGFAGKRKLLKESLFPEGSNPQVRLDFSNGKTILFTLPDALLAKFAAHGAEQKLGDETAGTQDVDDMYNDVEELIGKLNEGIWSPGRQGSGFGGISLLIKALMEVTGKTEDQIKLWIKDKKPAEKTALKNSPKVKPVYDRLEAEKAAGSAKVDTDALLGDLAAIA
jgi:hypothetical protein